MPQTILTTILAELEKREKSLLLLRENYEPWDLDNARRIGAKLEGLGIAMEMIKDAGKKPRAAPHINDHHCTAELGAPQVSGLSGRKP